MPYAKNHIKEKERTRYLRRKTDGDLQEYKYESKLKDGSEWNKGENNPMYGIKRNGKDSPNWKGGITPKNKIIRGSHEYRVWRSKVFERDNWICQTCNKRSCYLEAHHIKHFAKYIELRFEINNGVTLCRECHLLVHNLTKLQEDK